jgi:hypothetical protein
MVDKGERSLLALGDPSAKRRVLVAGLVHNTNTFVGGRTSLEDFEILRGAEMVAMEDGDPALSEVADQEFLHVFGMDVAREEQRGACVPKVVKSYLRQSRARQERNERLRRSVGLMSVPVFVVMNMSP